MLKQHIRRSDGSKSLTLSGIMARYSGMRADKEGGKSEVYTAKGEMRSVLEGARCFVRNKRGHLVRGWRSKGTKKDESSSTPTDKNLFLQLVSPPPIAAPLGNRLRPASMTPVGHLEVTVRRGRGQDSGNRRKVPLVMTILTAPSRMHFSWKK